MRDWLLGLVDVMEQRPTEGLACIGCGRITTCPAYLTCWWSAPFPRIPAICPRCWETGWIRIPIRDGRHVRVRGQSFVGGIPLRWQGGFSRN